MFVSVRVCVCDCVCESLYPIIRSACGFAKTFFHGVLSKYFVGYSRHDVFMLHCHNQSYT